MPQETGRRDHWALVLAGGDGARCRSSCEAIYEDHRPKQFCSFLGGKTLVADTLERTHYFADEVRTMVSVCRKHLPWRNLWRFGRVNTLVQPWSCDTGPAVLQGALRATTRSPNATLGIFPSDHFVSNGRRFMASVAKAAQFVDLQNDAIVMIGVEATLAETEYGWLVPQPGDQGPLVPRPAKIVEKPKREVASALQLLGAYWNTSVVVCKADTLVRLIAVLVPDWWKALAKAPFNTAHLDHAYRSLPSFGLSRDVLQRTSNRVWVLPVSGVRWTDLGSDRRIVEVRTSLEADHRRKQSNGNGRKHRPVVLVRRQSGSRSRPAMGS